MCSYELVMLSRQNSTVSKVLTNSNYNFAASHEELFLGFVFSNLLLQKSAEASWSFAGFLCGNNFNK